MDEKTSLERAKAFDLEKLDEAALRLSQMGAVELGNAVISAAVLIADQRDDLMVLTKPQTNDGDLKRLFGLANRLDTVRVFEGAMRYPTDEDKADALAIRRAADHVKVAMARLPA